jgi:hypothetical protein
MGMLLRSARVLVLLLVVVVASTGVAETTSQAAAEPQVSGIEVSDVEYTLATDRPDLIVGVSFAATPADAERVAVRLHEGGEWSSCAHSGASVECRLASPVPLDAATELAVSVS